MTDYSLSLSGFLAAWGELGLSAAGFVLLVLLILACSAYVKIATVLSIVRLGLGVDSIPALFITGSLALALSFVVMFPTLEKSTATIDSTLHNQSEGSIEKRRVAALQGALEVWREFAEHQTNKDDQAAFAALVQKTRGEGAPKNEMVSKSWQVVLPAFVVGQLKEAFRAGLILLLPLLVIDLIVANILAVTGLVQLNAHLVAFPFKLLLFVLANGWTLIATNLIAAYSR